ncbi:tyrosine-type recombinase/integrase [Candidatus Dependentiae bacterium]|nr:tyrosine-type recombinase/integrase [Candidatus Dependentiae bacterium]
MNALIEKFKHHLIAERYVSVHTVEAYIKDIYQFAHFLKTIANITSFHEVALQQVKDFLKYARYTLKISPRSLSRKLSAIKTFSHYLHYYHQVPLFTKGAIFPKLPKHLPRYLSEEQIQVIIKTAQQDESALGYRNRVIIYLLYACGIRVSELVNIKIDHIHFSEHYLQVYGKGNKERIIPIPKELIVTLQHFIDFIRPQFFNSEKKSSDLLFLSRLKEKESSLTRISVYTIIKTLAQKAGLLHAVSPHVLRHSLATHLLKKGANLRVLQMLLGHEKLTTVQVYTHMDVSYLRQMYDKYHPRAK